MKKIAIAVVFASIIACAAFADPVLTPPSVDWSLPGGFSTVEANRGMFGSVDGYLLLTNENDLTQTDSSLLTSELAIYKNVKMGTFWFQPYYYFKNQNYNLPSQVLGVTENMVGGDILLMSTALNMFSLGAAYKYRSYSLGGSPDSLLVTRMRLDF